ncbi:hypothetical protein [Draconibacterium mangrovi]|uniref:hypothetical protein n=1 Tax=Draconibacterium mangrovi TaxID=2697469 RepID=UPI0013D2C636|nr:hypothetical protein [Draconibacterium mangrovi]
MAYITDARKRDFVKQITIFTETNKDVLIAAGFDPSERIEELKASYAEAMMNKEKQIEAMAQAKDATKKAQLSLLESYSLASKTVELFTGLLGKDATLVTQIKKLRK